MAKGLQQVSMWGPSVSGVRAGGTSAQSEAQQAIRMWALIGLRLQFRPWCEIGHRVEGNVVFESKPRQSPSTFGLRAPSSRTKESTPLQFWESSVQSDRLGDCLCQLLGPL